VPLSLQRTTREGRKPEYPLSAKPRFDGQVKYDCFLRDLSENPPARFRLFPAFRQHQVVSAKPSFDGHLTVWASICLCSNLPDNQNNGQ
jgi:hypothetical protein